MTFEQWEQYFPDAAAALRTVGTEPTGTALETGAEKAAEQKVRLRVAKAGGLIWRNNVGATPAVTNHICPKCRFHFKERQQPIRYGLANDSAKLNAHIKSSDLIGVVPRLIEPQHVGQKVGQFVAFEVKRPGWEFNENGRETAQKRFIDLVQSRGGFGGFTTGGIDLGE